MLSIDYIRQNPEELKQNIKNRGLDTAKHSVDKLLSVDKERRELLQKVEVLRKERNEIAKTRDEGSFARGKEIKAELKDLEPQLKDVQDQYQTLMDLMPNITHPDMPIGSDSSGNVEIRSWGGKPKFDFAAKDHLALGEHLDLIDVKKAAEVSGSRFYYLKNEAVLMQFAIFTLALKKIVDRGFTPIVVPVLVSHRALYGTGYFPSESDQVYKLECGKDKIEKGRQLYLVGTSEQAIVSYHADEVLKEAELPKKYIGYSTCFRSEAGSWGKDVRGIKRVHQFDKVELIYFTTPETSQKYMQEASEIEEGLLQDLELPYRVIEMCTGDVGLATYRKFDVEVWLPSEQVYIETHSNSDLAAYHARRLNIKYQKGSGTTDYVHTISSTAITNARTILAILDNYQQEDGSVRVPEVLQEFVGKDVITPVTS